MWDLCAGEALIQSMMGVVCDSDHQPLYYDHEAEDYTIMNGINVFKNKTVFYIANERIIQNTGMDLAWYQRMTDIETAEYKAQKAARLAK